MKLSDKAREILGTLAPMLGTALGGPFGAIAGTILGAAVGKAGVPVTPASVEKAILGADPATLLAIKKAETEFTEHMRQLDITEAQLQYADVASARSMQVTTRSFLVPSLAVIIVLAFIGMVASTLLGYSHVEGALAGTLVGYLSAKCEQVVGFYFGSSASSKSKDATIEKMVDTA